MKKCIFLVLAFMSLNSVYATNEKVGENVSSYNYEYHKPYSQEKSYAKGNISPESLPKAITQYLKKNYRDYEIIVSKKKNNGKYFVKIRYDAGYSHPYYRSLVFDQNGKAIKG